MGIESVTANVRGQSHRLPGERRRRIGYPGCASSGGAPRNWTCPNNTTNMAMVAILLPSSVYECLDTFLDTNLPHEDGVPDP
jgi:hypothetical protein